MAGMTEDVLDLRFGQIGQTVAVGQAVEFVAECGVVGEDLAAFEFGVVV
jgi:hypothetical protein